MHVQNWYNRGGRPKRLRTWYLGKYLVDDFWTPPLSILYMDLMQHMDIIDLVAAALGPLAAALGHLACPSRSARPPLAAKLGTEIA